MEASNIKNDNLWFENLPPHWFSINMNYVCDFIMGQAPHSDSYNMEGKGEPFIKTGDFGPKFPTIKWFTTDPLVYGRDSDVFICVVGATAGKINLGVDGTISRSIAGLRPNDKIKREFLYYFLDCNYQKLNDSAQGSAQGIINKSILSQIKVPVPPLSEQAQIAAFLDQKTAQIDNIIEKKQKLLQLLEEKKKSVINEAVTGQKVWDGNAWVKPVHVMDSGVNCIGIIPANWEISKLKYLTEKIGSGVTPRGGSETYEEEGIMFIRSQNVYFDGLRLDDVVFISETTHNLMSNSKVRFLDVLLNITGASIGRSTVVDIKDEFNVNQHVCIIRCNKELNPFFLNYLLFSDVGQSQIRLGITGGNREGLNFENLKDFVIPLPGLKIQDGIVNSISEFIQNSDHLKSKILLQIEKLKEYRQSLISEAVTGKIDLSNFN